jgi:hypothetical protein
MPGDCRRWVCTVGVCQFSEEAQLTKIKTITVSYPHYDNSKSMPLERTEAPRVYRVEKVTDSTAFAPYAQLSKMQVDDLCIDDLWKVIVVPVK